MEKFDVIVAGAGSAGSMAAKTLAEEGINVCIVDVKKKCDIGKKICGDAIGKHHFERLGLKPPAPEEVDSIMEGVKIFSPDRETSYVVKGKDLYGYVLNRHRFGQRLLEEALDAGAVLQDESQVLAPIMEKGFIVGVTVKRAKDGHKEKWKSKIVMDATGFSAALRKKLAPEVGIEQYVENCDVEACYREIRHLDQPLEDPNLCQIYLTQTETPGGYYWIFPKGKTNVNVGLGVAMLEKFPNPKTQLYRYVLSQPLFEGSSIVEKGAWYVPTRRPLDSMVGNGVMIIGDAACQVNPIHGGGIGPSMIGGLLAGKRAAEALEEGQASREKLWRYNVDYVRDYGAKQAGLEVFRFLLQNMDDRDLNYGMRYRLLTEEDVLKASIGEDADISINDKVRIALRGLKKLNILRKLRNATKLMREIKAWYRSYPEHPKDFEKWKTGSIAIFEKAIMKLE